MQPPLGVEPIGPPRSSMTYSAVVDTRHTSTREAENPEFPPKGYRARRAPPYGWDVRPPSTSRMGPGPASTETLPAEVEPFAAGRPHPLSPPQKGRTFYALGCARLPRGLRLAGHERVRAIWR